MDAVQFAAVARRLREDREGVERQANELRAKSRKESIDGDDPFDLLTADEGLLRHALMRAVRWISVRREGIVVLTRAGAFVGAYLARDDRNPGRGGHRRPRLLPPSVEATRECRSWIENPEAFLAGARLLNGRWGRVPTEEELLPDYRAEESV